MADCTESYDGVTITVIKEGKMYSRFQSKGKYTVDHCKGSNRNIIWDEGRGPNILPAKVLLTSESLFNQLVGKQGKTVSFRGRSTKMYFTGNVQTNGTMHIVPVEFVEVA